MTEAEYRKVLALASKVILTRGYGECAVMTEDTAAEVLQVVTDGIRLYYEKHKKTGNGVIL